MRIVDVRATPINVPLEAPYRYATGYHDAMTKTIVEVEADDGLVGLGENAEGNSTALVLRMKELLIGADPFDIADCEQRCLPTQGYSLWANLASARRVFGAIEIALWDLRGRAEGRPLYQLLGGAHRKEIAFTEYFAARCGRESTPTELASYCARMAEEHGANAFEGKVATFDLSTEVKMVKEIRAAIGEQSLLRLDANSAWTLSTAREACRRFDPYNVTNIEDPVGSYEAMKRLRAHTSILFSTHRPDLPRAVQLGVPDYIVANLVDLGGIRRTVQFAEACALMDVGFWFHSGDTGIATAGYLHASAAVRGMSEPHQSLLRWTADDVIVGGPFRPHDGLVSVPEGPGLGVDLDREALTRLHAAYREMGPFPDHPLGRISVF